MKVGGWVVGLDVGRWSNERINVMRVAVSGVSVLSSSSMCVRARETVLRERCDAMRDG